MRISDWSSDVCSSDLLLNLLSNAVKFTECGGAVTLTAERSEGGSLRIVVSDTGIGVPADRIPQLFEPFRQVENVHARRHHGTGLGLYISKGERKSVV